MPEPKKGKAKAKPKAKSQKKTNANANTNANTKKNSNANANAKTNSNAKTPKPKPMPKPNVSRVRYIKVSSSHPSSHRGGSWGCDASDSGSSGSLHPAGNMLGYSMIMPSNGSANACPHCGTSSYATSAIAGIPRTDVVQPGLGFNNMMPAGTPFRLA